jgi:hypothetical protein
LGLNQPPCKISKRKVSRNSFPIPDSLWEPLELGPTILKPICLLMQIKNKADVLLSMDRYRLTYSHSMPEKFHGDSLSMPRNFCSFFPSKLYLDVDYVCPYLNWAFRCTKFWLKSYRDLR